MRNKKVFSYLVCVNLRAAEILSRPVLKPIKSAEYNLKQNADSETGLPKLNLNSAMLYVRPLSWRFNVNFCVCRTAIKASISC